MRSSAHPCRLIGLVLLFTLLAGVARTAGVRGGAHFSMGAVGCDASREGRATAFARHAREPAHSREHHAHLDFLSTSNRSAASRQPMPQPLHRPLGRVVSSLSPPIISARRLRIIPPVRPPYSGRHSASVE